MSTHPLLESHAVLFTGVIDHCKSELASVRTGRAHASMVSDILVMAYGVAQPLKALASITVPDSRTITVEPWDKSIVADIERGIREANLGVNPVNDGRVIRIPMPQMTEEARRDMAKLLGQKLEQARISIRQLRDEAREKIQAAEKNKELNEDERYRLQDQLDEMVKDYNERIKTMGDEKEKEIMTI
ncbi:MAG: ribosome recycling factor [Patescibacteria group bacterium]